MTRTVSSRDRGFGNTRQEYTEPADKTNWARHEKLRRPYDRNAVPPGRQEDAWGLALFWNEKRDEYGHPGPSLVVICAELEHVIDQCKVRDDPGWEQIVRRMIEYFWDYEEAAAIYPATSIHEFAAKGYFLENYQWERRKEAEAERKAARAAEPEGPRPVRIYRSASGGARKSRRKDAVIEYR